VKPAAAAKRKRTKAAKPPRTRRQRPARSSGGPAVPARNAGLFEAALWTVARQYAGTFGFAFEQGCELDFRRLARASFVRVAARPGPLVDADVRANTETLVAAMIDEARAQGATTLHEWTLKGALAKVCPLYPFC
jgi:hypothetical protein